MPSPPRRGNVDEILALRWAVLRPGRPEAEARWPGDDAAQHWLVEDSDRVVAVLSLFPSPMPGGGPAWQLRGMAVDPARRGEGLGRGLLEAALRALGEPVWCNARTGAVGFYTALGWQVVGPPFDIPGVGPHLRLVRAAG